MRKQLSRGVALVAAGVLAFSGLAVTANASGPDASQKEVQEKAQLQSAINYWTPERMAQAKPKELALPSDGKQISEKTVQDTQKWGKGGKIADTVVKIFFQQGTGTYVCSGTVVNDSDSNKALILTAGHCVYDQETKSYSKNMLFIPNYDSNPVARTDCKNAKFGCWTQDQIVVSNEYTSRKSVLESTPYDFAFVTVGRGGNKNALIDDTVGSQPIKFDLPNKGDNVHLMGYPAADPYDGKVLYESNSTLRTRETADKVTVWEADSMMTGGCSGGPWFVNMRGADYGEVVSVNSAGPKSRGWLVGPQFTDGMRTLYSKANGGSAPKPTKPVTSKPVSSKPVTTKPPKPTPTKTDEQPGSGDLQNGETVNVGDLGRNQSKVFTVAIPSGVSNFSVTVANNNSQTRSVLTGKFGSEPTDSDRDCWTYRYSSTATCNIRNAQAGTYYFKVEARIWDNSGETIVARW